MQRSPEKATSDLCVEAILSACHFLEISLVQTRPYPPSLGADFCFLFATCLPFQLVQHICYSAENPPRRSGTSAHPPSRLAHFHTSLYHAHGPPTAYSNCLLKRSWKPTVHYVRLPAIQWANSPRPKTNTINIHTACGSYSSRLPADRSSIWQQHPQPIRK